MFKLLITIRNSCAEMSGEFSGHLRQAVFTLNTPFQIS